MSIQKISSKIQEKDHRSTLGLKLPNSHKDVGTGLQSKQKVFYATGKRKTAIARVFLTKGGCGKIIVNDKEDKSYFIREYHILILHHPFKAIDLNNFDVKCTVQGGGLSSQAEAIRHGISKALCLFNQDFKTPLRSSKLLTRDSRKVERKKPGQPKARKKFQFSKR